MDEFFNFVLEQLEVNIIKDPITSEVEFEVYDKMTGPDVKVRDKNLIERFLTKKKNVKIT